MGNSQNFVNILPSFVHGDASSQGHGQYCEVFIPFDYPCAETLLEMVDIVVLLRSSEITQTCYISCGSIDMLHL